MLWIRRLMLAFAASALLVAAGCGGSSEPRRLDTWEAEGLWAGTTSSGGTLDGVILDTGEYWLIYGFRGVARSVVHGSGFFTRGAQFRSDDATDYFFGFDRPFFSSLAATVQPAFAINGELFLADQLEGFGLAYVPDYRLPADPRAIVGRWLGSASTLLSAGDFVIDIDASGSFTASLAGGCAYGGRILPNRGGRNVFDIAMASLPSCPFLYSANGVLIATGGRLVITAVTPDRRDVFYAVGR